MRTNYFDNKEVVLPTFKDRSDLNGLTGTATIQSSGKYSVRVDKPGEMVTVDGRSLKLKTLAVSPLPVVAEKTVAAPAPAAVA